MPALSLVPHATRAAVAVACALALTQGASAQADKAVPAETAASAASGLAAEAPPVDNSALDAPLFYQLLIGEMELRSGEVGTAYQVLLDAARKTQDPVHFRRATEI